MQAARWSTLFAIAACLGVTACAAESVGTEEAPVISDQRHNGGTPGFYFLSPMVPGPDPVGPFEPRVAPVVKVDTLGIPPEIAAKPIDELELSVRVYNALKRTGISTIGELLDLMNKSGGNLTNLRNFGDKSMQELREKLAARGLIPAEEGVAVEVEPADGVQS